MSIPTYEQVEKLVGAQKHLIKYYNELSDDEKLSMYNQLKSIDFEASKRWYEESAVLKTTTPEKLAPVPEENYIRRDKLPQDDLDKYWKSGLEAIALGQVCAIVLAGGQASRLGSKDPKGTIPLGIDTAFGDSLLGIQAAKIALLQKMAEDATGLKNSKIHWAIMTSPGTNKATVEHVKKIAEHHGFDFDEQITIFNQAEIPAYDKNGEFLLATKSSLVAAPNGNGGMYSALAPHMGKLRAKGIKFFHVYCVDNILCKVADPHFIGFASTNGADIATKCVPKQKGELVGSVCLDEGKPKVVEYSELGPELADARAPDGSYLFGAGSIANHFFHIDLFEKLCNPKFQLPYHRAHKKIAYIDTTTNELVKPSEPNGIKLEQFIFDVFEHSTKFFIWEVPRSEEFSPLKNAESAGKDCLSTCRRDLAALNAKWLEKVGVKLNPSQPFFIKTLVSYDGENLNQLRGREINKEVIESDEAIRRNFSTAIAAN